MTIQATIQATAPADKKRRLSGRREILRKLERAMRFELTTPTLARLCSTTELRPHPVPQVEGEIIPFPPLCKVLARRLGARARAGPISISACAGAPGTAIRPEDEIDPPS